MCRTIVWLQSVNIHMSNIVWWCCSYLCVIVSLADHPNSCRFLNSTSPSSLSYVKQCNNVHVDSTDNDDNDEYECRKLIVSYRFIDTYLRRDCARKGRCSWKDKTQSMTRTPISDCVYTDDQEERLECIHCCDTSLCNRTVKCYRSMSTMLIYLLVFGWNTHMWIWIDQLLSWQENHLCSSSIIWIILRSLLSNEINVTNTFETYSRLILCEWCQQ
jgi:hypothetical protein